MNDAQPLPNVVMVKFCSLCGEREDNPDRTAWCDEDPLTNRRYGPHLWGHPQKVYERRTA